MARWLVPALLCSSLCIQAANAQACSLPAALPPVPFNVSETAAAGTRLFSAHYEPEDAVFDSLRVGGSLGAFYSSKLQFRLSNASQLSVHSVEDLSLPPYPSTITEAYLPIEINCNGVSYMVGIVAVQNVNNNKPSFYNLPYRMSVSEAMPVNSTFDAPVLAIDWDPSSFYTLSFNISRGDDDGYFGLETIVGAVHSPQTLPSQFDARWTSEQLPSRLRFRLLRQLDYDFGPRLFRLEITATDNGGSDRQTPTVNSTVVQVAVFDADDLPPAFTYTSYRGNISLTAAVGDQVSMEAPIVAVDGDPALQSPIQLRLVEDTVSHLFGINETSGSLYLQQAIPDDLMQLSFDFVVQAHQTDDPSKASTAYVHIDILATDKSYPSFTDCLYEATIPENSGPGTYILRLQAVDTDRGAFGQFRFELRSSADATAFALDNDTGVLSVSGASPLDRELRDTYRFQVDVAPVASSALAAPDDACSTAAVHVRLADENDNAPAFTQSTYFFNISDTIKKNSVVGVVFANDTDLGANGAVAYGDVTQERGDEDEAVAFSGFANERGQLEIVIAFESVSRPRFRRTYRLTVEASDGADSPRWSRASVEVAVAFGNAHVPTFERAEYRAAVAENSRADTSVVQVHASDPDEAESGQFDYVLMGDHGPFAIDRRSGWIRVANSTALDRERRAQFAFTVTAEQLRPAAVNATDQLTEATVIVDVIDLNDNSPRFVNTVENRTDEYHFFIDTSFEVDDFVGKVEATDADATEAGLVDFVAISVPNYFDFSPDGTVTVGRALPAKAESVYTLVVAARDRPLDELEQRQAIATIKVFVASVGEAADVRLQNLPNSIALSESFPVGSLVFSVSVADADERDVRFAVLDGDPRGHFDFRRESLVVAKPLDAETRHEYALLIRATDAATGAATNATLTVTVEDANDHAPLFETTDYTFTLNTSYPGSFIGAVRATDGDAALPNSQISYELEFAATGIFEIDAHTGQLYAGENLRTENYQEFSFSVLARDHGQPRMQALAFVTVLMHDELAVPRFTQVQYGVEVMENEEPKAIARVLALHPYEAPKYAIEKNPGQLFAMDADEGVVSTLAPLDYEKSRRLELSVSACTTGAQSRCSSVPLVVSVRDANDNAPVFERAEYEVRAPLDLTPGSELTRVRAFDADSGALGELSYALRTPSAHLAIDFESGLVLLTAPFRAAAVHNLTVEAFDHGSPSRRGVAQLVVIVNGSNPTEPRFDQFMHKLQLPEDVPPDTLLVDLDAFDPDPGLEGQLMYRFADDAATQRHRGLFRLDARNGQLALAAPLDFDTQPRIQLMVEAVDAAPLFPRAGRTLVDIQLTDVNDNAPVFEPLPSTVFISSARSPGALIVGLRATDADRPGSVNSSVDYSLRPADSPFFALANGSLVVRNRLARGRYQVELVASDGGAPPLSASHFMSIVVMSDKDKYPVFPQISYAVDLPRNATLPRLLHTFTATVQSGKIKYYVLFPSDTKGLALDADSGRLVAEQQVNNGLLKENRLTLVIRAINDEHLNFFSDIVVTVTMVDFASDQRAVSFGVSLFRAVLAENTPAGAFLNQTVHVDNADLVSADAPIVYWLSPNDTFGIMSDGRIFTKKVVDLEQLDASLGGVLSLTVFASSDDNVAETKLEVKIDDVNEYSPAFEQAEYSYSVPEDMQAGDLIATITATDKDYNEVLRYALSDVEQFVSIDDAGNLRKADGRSFDHEAIALVNVTVSATDRLNHSTTTSVLLQVLDVNDNAPTFSHAEHVWNVYEGEVGVEESFQLEAVDADSGDNGEVAFLLQAGPSSAFFQLRHTAPGLASLSLVRQLDREQKGQHFVTIEARDDGQPSQFVIAIVEVNVLDVNDNPPRFFEAQYVQTVPSDFPIGFALLTVLADDDDANSTVEYSIVSDPSQLFKLDETHGRLGLRRPLPSHNDTYELIIEASDGVASDKAVVTITVVDAGDSSSGGGGDRSAPSFSQQLYNLTVVEGARSEPIGRVVAVAADGRSSRLHIEPVHYQQFFRIDNSSGHLLTERALTFDADRSFYNFLVVAEDDGSPPMSAFAQVVVHVLDANDHAPRFDKPDYSAVVPADAKPPHSLLLKMAVTDDDYGENAKLRYSLEGEDAACFDVQADTGQIALTCTPDYAKRQQYDLEVVATDRFGLGNATSAALTVLVSPPVSVTTTLPPVGVSSTASTATTPLAASSTATQPPSAEDCLAGVERSVSVAVPEITPVGTVVASLQPKQACQLEFRLTSANEFFSIGAASGQLTIERTLDREALSSALVNDVLPLTIAATSANETVEVSLSIFLAERTAESTGFSFNETIFEFSIDEDLPIGAFVGRMDTTSVDAENYAVLFDSPFDVGPDGALLVRQVIDLDLRDTDDYYSLVVAALWSNATDYALVNVRVTELNDHDPRFPVDQLTIEIPEGPYGSGGAQLRLRDAVAADADRGEAGRVTYGLDGADGLPFDVEPLTGRLRVFGLVDRERVPVYAFNLTAVDGGSPARRTSAAVRVVVLDVNDNAPVFVDAPLAAAVRQSAAVGSVVAAVSARDADAADNGRLFYRLLSHADYFTIDTQSGVVATRTSLNASVDAFLLSLLAQDFGRPPRVGVLNISVQVRPEGEHTPNFRQKSHFITLDSNLEAGKAVLQPLAGADTYRYELIDGASNLFALNESTGMLSLARLPTTSELGTTFTFQIKATDENGQSDSATVKAFVSNPNDPIGASQRQFTVSQYWVELPENTVTRTLLIDLNSTLEIQQRQVVYSFDEKVPDAFEIDSKTGAVFAVKPLDREMRSLYIVKVRARHGNSSRRRRQALEIADVVGVATDETLVVVNVTDANDNAPRFGHAHSPLVLSMRADATVGTHIGRVLATDDDGGSWIRYSLKADASGGDDYRSFTIDATSGVVLVAGQVGAEHFAFEVVASDGLNSVALPVEVYKLTDRYQVILVSEKRPRDLHQVHTWSLERRLSKLTGWNVSVSSVSPHIDADYIYANMSDIRIYAVDPITKRPVTGSQLSLKVNEHFDTLATELSALRLVSVRLPPTGAQPQRAMTVLEISLIVISLVFILTTIVTVILLLRCLKRGSKEDALPADYMVDSTSSGARPYDTETLDRKTANTLLIPQRGPFAGAVKPALSALSECVVACGGASAATPFRQDASAATTGSLAAYDTETAYMESSGSSDASVASRRYPYFDDYAMYAQPSYFGTPVLARQVDRLPTKFHSPQVKRKAPPVPRHAPKR